MDRWLLGAEGEEVAAASLARLPDGWTVLHDITIEITGANLDHVVVGPPGVFVINTKHRPDADITVHADRLLVNGYPTTYLRDCEWEARRASQRLRVATGQRLWVTPVLLFVGSQSLTYASDPAHVQVVTADTVVEWLTRQPARLDPTDVAEVADYACQPAVWLPPAQIPESNPYRWWVDPYTHTPRSTGYPGPLQPVGQRPDEPARMSRGTKVAIILLVLVVLAILRAVASAPPATTPLP